MAKEILVDRYGRPVPQYLNPANDQYEHLYGSDGALHVKLVSGGEAVAAELTSSQKEVVARAIDGIIDTIGLENIACFLPMWENTGTELRDLIHPDLRFRVWGATPGVVGPFGSAWAFDGVNDYIEEAPAIETAAGSAEVALDSGTKMLAQRLKLGQMLRPVGFVRLRLKRVGSPSGTLAVEIREDAGGVPGTVVAATSMTVSASDVYTSAEWIGFGFASPVNLSALKLYWLVLKWASATTVDASNHVTWIYDSTGAYGEPRATYDGTAWTATSGQSHSISIYADHIAIRQGTYIVATMPLMAPVPQTRALLCHGAGDGISGAREIVAIDVRDGRWLLRDRSMVYNEIIVYRETNFDRYIVVSLALSKDASTDKIVAYWNGQKVGALSGTAGQESTPVNQPLTLGAVQRQPGPINMPTGYYLGRIGALIVARVPLTQQQVVNVTRHLLALRRYKVTGV